MAVQETRKRLALDTNIPLDLAAGEDFAHAFIEAFREKGYALQVPPTVVQELSFLAFTAGGMKRERALAALRNLRAWGIEPYDLQSVGHGITEQFAHRLIEKRLPPEAEFNDGLILTETAEAVIADAWSHGYSRESAAYPAPWLREFKFWPAVGRIDNVFGDRNLVCSCPPMAAYSDS